LGGEGEGYWETPRTRGEKWVARKREKAGRIRIGGRIGWGMSNRKRGSLEEAAGPNLSLLGGERVKELVRERVWTDCDAQSAGSKGGSWRRRSESYRGAVRAFGGENLSCVEEVTSEADRK